jgi:hypothetical protein
MLGSFQGEPERPVCFRLSDRSGDGGGGQLSL